MSFTEPYTLESLLALPTADYIPLEEVNLDPQKMVSTPMCAAVITNPTSKFPVACTGSVRNCLAVVIINKGTHTIMVAHLEDEENGRPSLQHLVDLVRRNPSDKVDLIFFGAELCNDSNEEKDRWSKRMQGIVEDINKLQNEHVEVKGFDVNDKPHPRGIAVEWNGENYKVVRLNRLIGNESDRSEDAWKTQGNGLKYITTTQGQAEIFQPEKFVYQFRVIWDGRLPENQEQNMVDISHRKPSQDKSI